MKTKFILLFYCLCFLSISPLVAQTISEGFEADCAEPSFAFSTGCIDSWISTHGSPDTKSDFQGISAFEGSKYAHMWVKKDLCLKNGQYIDTDAGEGVAFNHNFVNGLTYEFSFAVRSEGSTENIRWVLTSGFPNQSGGGGSCNAASEVPPIPAGAITVWNVNDYSTSSWQVKNVSFTVPAQGTFDQLWFRPSNITHFADTYGTDVFLDDFELIEPCEINNFPVSIFHFEDADGEEKTEFCFGEEIFLDGLASINETHHFVEIGIFNPSNVPEGYPDTMTWTSVNELINLTDLLALIGPAGNTYFKPDYTYRVKLAVGNFCDPWEEVSHEFTVVCCDTLTPDPGFNLQDIEWEDNHYTLIPVDYDVHEEFNPIHEWYIFTSPNQSGTPATAVTILTGETFAYEPAEYGIFYFVMHKVITECGEYCALAGLNVLDGHDGFRDQEDDLMPGTVDCSIVDTIFPPCSSLIAPTNLQVDGTVLTWAPVPGAVSYTVYGQIGGISACNCGGTFQFSFIIGTSTTYSINVPDWLINRCFQWNVVANCGEGISSMLSEPACYAPVQLFGGSVDSREGESTQNKFTREGFSVFPNPANDHFEVSNTSANDASIGLYHINGQLITQLGDVSAMSQISVNTSHLAPGIYLLNINNKTNGQLMSSQKIIIQR